MILEGTSMPYGKGTLTVSVELILPAEASLSGVGTLTAQESKLLASSSLSGIGTLSLAMRVIHILNATDIKDITIDLSDREIYNDIRAECDIWDILTLHPDTTPTYFETYEVSETFDCPADSVGVHYLTIPSTDEETHWINVWISGISMDALEGLTQPECEAIEVGTDYEGEWSSPYCYLPPRYSRFRLLIQGTDWETHTSLACQIYNRYPSYSAQVTVTGTYYALDPSQRYYKLRSTDETSILKYGRRVMNLTWPLGQTPEQMQDIIDLYLERYSEPVSFVKIKLLGTDTEWQRRILDYDINDVVQLVHAGLNLDTEFFINSIDCRHDVNGILEGTFDLEEVREMEQ